MSSGTRPIADERSFEVSECVAFWLDLVGYSSMLQASNLDLRTEAGRAAMMRLRAFHRAAWVPTRDSNVLPLQVMSLNDSIVVTADLPPAGNAERVAALRSFVYLAYLNFVLAWGSDAHVSRYAGVRAAIATGTRVKGWGDLNVDANIPSGLGQSIAPGFVAAGLVNPDGSRAAAADGAVTLQRVMRGLSALPAAQLADLALGGLMFAHQLAAEPRRITLEMFQANMALAKAHGIEAAIPAMPVPAGLLVCEAATWREALNGEQEPLRLRRGGPAARRRGQPLVSGALEVGSRTTERIA